MDKLEIKYIKLGKLKPFKGNPRKIEPAEMKKLRRSLKDFGFVDPVIARRGDNMVIGGHQRLEAARLEKWTKDIPVVFLDDIDDNRAALLNIALNKVQGEFDWPKLGDLFASMDDGTIDLEMSGFSLGEIGDLMSGLDNASGGITEDEVPDPPAEPISKTGDLWLLGSHRLLCGDSTKVEDVERLMGGEKAVLIHADPPYGMGKEKEGIANDNLYREKLDAFQMAWWEIVRWRYLVDNGSVYIWGNAEDLWRLWHWGGLADSLSGMTFRNEIIWDKGHGQGMESEQHRMYPTVSERCLFFMLGKQGFNNNADNYWEGFEPVRSYLDGERLKMGWNNKTIADWFGFHPRMADHWFSESQWSFPQEEQYKRLQKEAKSGAFKRDYAELKKEHDKLKLTHDELKQEFYATRAYFDNTHENMTDVWQFDRVKGEERHGHATPKPVKMVGRILKSSSPDNGLTYDPFSGSGTTIIAAEQLGRKCYAMEISPIYTDVAVKRWENLTGLVAKLDKKKKAG